MRKSPALCRRACCLDGGPARAYARSGHNGRGADATATACPLGQALGTEALGIDLAHLDDAGFAWIASSFAEHPVLVFREQSLGAADLAGFGARFGRPRPHSLINYRYPGQPDVSYLRNVDDAGKIDWFGVKRATAWHTDSTYEAELPLLAILHAAPRCPRSVAGRSSPICAPPTTRSTAR